MYKILNKIFGWDYIQWQGYCDEGISRVERAGNGKAFYWKYKTIHVAKVIEKPCDVLWLTCEPEKYLGGKNEN